jgi:NAD(P)-dependent dehydrogenase (short-subunit alcohol dehydrogenase family)
MEVDCAVAGAICQAGGQASHVTCDVTRQAAFEVMKAQGCGRIIITSSITGPRTGIAGLAHYAASKAGINGFIKVAALEFARFGVTVNAIEPGTIATEGVIALGAEYLKRAAETLPINRLGTVDDCRSIFATTASAISPYDLSVTAAMCGVVTSAGIAAGIDLALGGWRTTAIRCRSSITWQWNPPERRFDLATR